MGHMGMKGRSGLPSRGSLGGNMFNAPVSGARSKHTNLRTGPYRGGLDALEKRKAVFRVLLKKRKKWGR